MKAVYGKDVRRSIHDAIKQCYDDATGNPESVSKLAGEVAELHKGINEIEKNEVRTETLNTAVANKILSMVEDGTLATLEIPNKSIGEDKIADEFMDLLRILFQPSTVSLHHAEGRAFTLEKCANRIPDSFVIKGNTTNEESVITSLDSFNVILNNNEFPVRFSLNSLEKDKIIIFDELDIARKTLVQRIKKLVFTGDEEFSYNQWNCNVYTISDPFNYHNSESDYDTKCGAICTHFKLIGFDSINEMGAYKNGYFGLNEDGSKINFGYCPDGNTEATAEELKSYFKMQYGAGTPVTVYYILRSEQTELVTLDDFILNEGTNSIRTDCNFTMSIDYYADNGEDLPFDVDFVVEKVAESIGSAVQTLNGENNTDDAWWTNFKNKMGFDPAEQPVPQEVNKPLVTNSMLIVKGGKGRWGTNNTGGYSANGNYYEGSPFENGGHVFEAWNADETYRLTMLMGKFASDGAHIFVFKPQESGIEVYGKVTIGTDHEWEGLDVTQKYAEMHGTILSGKGFAGTTNYGSQKYYGGISGADKTKPSGANLEITSEAHSSAPNQAIFNACMNGLVVPVLSVNPAVLSNGAIWYDSETHKFKGVVNGQIKTFVME